MAVSMVALSVLAAVAWLMPSKDPREQYRRDLAAGKTVTLIGPTGNPRWHAWRYGATEFAASPHEDGACSYETLDLALLELLDDPGIDRYRIRAEIRQGASRFAKAGAPRDDENTIGIYFSYSDPAAEGRRCHAYFAVRFQDFDPVASQTNNVTQQRVGLERSLVVVHPDKPASAFRAIWGDHLFWPAQKRPGDWRTIEIDVTPERIEARWIEGGKSFAFAIAESATPQKKYGLLRKDLAELVPNSTIQIPDWRPRMPLGLVSQGSPVSVRNYTITPLASPF